MEPKVNTRTGWYILDEDDNPEPATNGEMATKWREANPARWRIARDEIGPVLVSTVFISLDHGIFQDEGPLVFESMIFGGKYDEETRRYSSKADALVGHTELVRMVRLDPNAATPRQEEEEEEER
jgi:hypothetical protein